MKHSQEFASVAEAVAHYFRQGYKTVYEGAGGRIMRRGRDEVVINHEGFLLVVAEEVIA
jgi:hypothetical protein